MFKYIELIPNGRLNMVNSSYQKIMGTHPIFFENLLLGGSTSSIKDLELTDCVAKGILSLDSRFNLNSNNFILDKNNPSNLNYIAGHIHSESYPPDYGTIQWNIQGATGTFSIPFGSGANNENDVNLLYTVVNAGSYDGYVKFATYHTPDFTNTPLPDGVFSLNPYKDMNVVDRFWIIEPHYNTRPGIQLGFKYTMQDIDNPNRIKQPDLKAIRYNTNSLAWDDWEPSSISDPDHKSLATGDVPKQYFFTNWTLASESDGGDFWIPNAFTPDRDESYNNEAFGPVITFFFSNYEFYIYNRWGQEIFKSTNINNKWDGTLQNEVVPGGVYTWLIVLTKKNNKRYKYTGTVNVIL
jgi:gliding motility-associated-like protein